MSLEFIDLWKTTESSGFLMKQQTSKITKNIKTFKMIKSKEKYERKREARELSFKDNKKELKLFYRLNKIK